MAIRIVNTLQPDVWRGFVDAHPQSSIFHTPEMFEVFQRVEGYVPRLWAAVDTQDGVLALLTPVEITLMGGLLQRLTTRSIAYASVLCAPGAAGQEALRMLLGEYARGTARKTLFTELRNLADLNALQPLFNDCGYRYEDHLDYLIDLKGTTEQVFENIGARTRKNLRRALRKGRVVVERISDRRLLPVWYALLSKTYEAARVPLANISLFEAAFDVLHACGMITFWMARIDQTYVAASAELGYKDTLYGWYGGLDRAYASECPGEMLMWRVLAWGTEQGYQVYDFGGAGKPGEAYGVRDFKAKFGGRLVCYGRNTYVHSPRLLALSTQVYGVYRQLVGLKSVPMRWTKKQPAVSSTVSSK